MDNRKIGFRLLKRIFEDWRWRRLTWQEAKEKYGIGKTSFFKYRKRFIKYADEGLKDKPRRKPRMPHALAWDQRIRILQYIYQNPTHGPQRIAYEQVPTVSPHAVWNFLKKEDLNTRRKRRLWAHYQGKPVLTQKEKQILAAKDRHVESSRPGQLISVDTLTVSVKGLGKLWQYTACDTYSSYGWAWIYRDKTSGNAVDFFMNHIFNTVPTRKIERVLTDQGTEFYNFKNKDNDSAFTNVLRMHSIKHTVTKVAHPWTNGYVERLNQTTWQEFYLCRLERPVVSLEALNKGLNAFMRYYNFNRRHSGYKLKKAGFEYPGHAFFDVKESSNIIEIKH